MIFGKLSILCAFLFLMACSSVQRGPAEVHEHEEGADHHHHEIGESDERRAKRKKETELPDDPAFIDQNGNGKIDLEEMRTDNLAPIIAGGKTIFAAKPILSMGLQKGQLILTIDDGPHKSLTPGILKLLEDYNIQATFFVTGSRVASHKDIIKDMYRAGHTIGNHTYSHNVKKISSSTIVSEIRKAHREIVAALDEEPRGRLLFRAPGLIWSTPKATNLNAQQDTRQFIGPFHANLGTDAPQADWHCWAKGKSSQTCADYYFNVIANKGRGIVLAHDVYYKKGRGNTYEMLKILLDKLNRNGGIKNINPNGFWEFVRLDNRSVLDKLDAGRISDSTYVVDNGPKTPFYKKPRTFVRTSKVLQESETRKLSNISKAEYTNGNFVRAGHILKVERLGSVHRVEDKYNLIHVRILEMLPSYNVPADRDVYIWEAAF